VQQQQQHHVERSASFSRAAAAALCADTLFLWGFTDDIIGIPANRQLSKDIYETRRTLSNINPAMAAAPIIKSFTDEHGHQLKELLPTSPRAFETLGERASEREIKSPMLVPAR
jgi:hypothetical protein